MGSLPYRHNQLLRLTFPCGANYVCNILRMDFDDNLSQSINLNCGRFNQNNFPGSAEIVFLIILYASKVERDHENLLVSRNI